ncbi:MAG: cation:dicarboxylate symporter family transporter [Gammaproteobacteria bacterium]
MRVFALLKNLSVQLLLILLGIVFFGQYIPLAFKSVFYTISLNIREILMLSLPIIVAVSLMQCLISQKNQALAFVLVLFSLVTLSNFVTSWVAYFTGSFGLSFFDLASDSATHIPLASQVQSLWSLSDYTHGSWRNYYKNEFGLLFGLVIGILFSVLQNIQVHQLIQKTNAYVGLFLERIFSPILPLFAFGFILKMQEDGVLARVIDAYLPMIAIIVTVILSYMALMFLLASGFNYKQSLIYLRQALPAGIMGFSTMSSLACIPVNIKAAEANTNNPTLAKAVIPATSSTHMMGDSIAIPIFAMALLYSAGDGIPSLHSYWNFACLFVVYKFTVAAVPGGSILVMLPLLQEQFGLTSEMSTLITTMYILFDPIVTAGNVMGNSAFVIWVHKIFKRFSKQALPAL